MLTLLLVLILALIGHRTLSKGCRMWRQESRSLRGSEVELADRGTALVPEYLRLPQEPQSIQYEYLYI